MMVWRVFKVLALVVGVLLVLVTSTATWAWNNLEGLVNDFRAELSTAVGGTLGRKVSFGPVQLTILDGTLTAVLTDVVVAGAGAQAPYQAHVPSVQLKLDARRMLWSRGRRLVVSQAIIEDPVVLLRRDAHGRWDFQDIVDHLPAQAAPARAEGAQQWFRELRITGMEVRRGTVVLEDALLERTLRMGDAYIRFSDVVPGRDVWADINVVLDDGNAKAHLNAHAEAHPLPANLDVTEVPELSASLRLDGLALGGWSQLVPPGFVRPATGILRLEMQMRTDNAAQTGWMRGSMRIADLSLADGDVVGKTATIEMDVDAEGSLRTETVNLHRLNITGAGLTMRSQMQWRGRRADGLEHAQVTLRVEDMGDVISLLPRGGRYLPQGLVLAGPLAARVEGDRQAANVRVNLDKTHVAYLERFDKPAGVPLHLEANLKRTAEAIEVDPVTLVASTARVDGAVVVPLDGSMPTGTLQTGDISLVRLMPLFPSVRRLRNGKLEGLVSLYAASSRHKDITRLAVDVSARRLQVQTPSVVLKGSARALLQRDGPSSRQGDWTALVQATPLEMLVRDDGGKDVLRKGSGIPLEAHVLARQQGADVDVLEAVVTAGSSFVQARGRLQGVGTPGLKLDARTQALELNGQDVRTWVPAAQRLPQPSHASATLWLHGPVHQPADLVLRAEDLTLVLGRSSVRGAVEVTGLQSSAVLQLEQTRINLDLTQLGTVVGNARIPTGTAAGTFSGTVVPSNAALLDIQMQGCEAKVWDTQLAWSGWLKNGREPTFELALLADHLDVEDLLARAEALRTGGAAPQNAQPALATTRSRPRGVLVLKTPRLTYGPDQLTDFSAELELGPTVKVHTLDADAYGGHLVLGGSEWELNGAQPLARLNVVLKGVDIAQALVAHGRNAKVSGKVNVAATVAFNPSTAQSLRESVHGDVVMGSPLLTVHGTNLLGQVFAPLQEATHLPLERQALLDPNAPTDFREVSVVASVFNQRAVLGKPLKAQTNFGAVELGGVVHLDSRLEMVGTASLRPQVVEDITGGAVRPPNAVLVPLLIGGTWSEPSVDGVDVVAFAENLGMGGVALQATKRAAELRRRADEARAQAQSVQQEVVRRARADAEDATRAAAAQAQAARRAAQHALNHPDQASAVSAQRARLKAQQAQRAADQARARVATLLGRSTAVWQPPPPGELADDAAAQVRARTDAMAHAARNSRSQINEAAQKDADATARQLKEDAALAKKKTQELLDRFSPLP